jgi:hypothetical protein
VLHGDSPNETRRFESLFQRDCVKSYHGLRGLMQKTLCFAAQRLAGDAFAAFPEAEICAKPQELRVSARIRAASASRQDSGGSRAACLTTLFGSIGNPILEHHDHDLSHFTISIRSRRPFGHGRSGRNFNRSRRQ